MNKKYIIAGLGKGIHGGEGGSITAENLIEIPTEVGSSSGAAAPAGPTKTSDLLNDGNDDGYGPFATVCSIPSFTSCLQNNGEGNGYPFATTDMISGGLNPYETAGGESIVPVGISTSSRNNHVTNSYASTMAGGACNSIEITCYAFMGSGVGNLIRNTTYGNIVGGDGNRVINNSSTDGGAACSSIVGGTNNRIEAKLSFIGGGTCNVILQDTQVNWSTNSTILNGYNNCLLGANKSTILGGDYNIIGDGVCNVGCSAVLNGVSNTIVSNFTTVIGLNNTTNRCFDNNILLGNCISVNRSCTTYVNNLSIMNVGLDTGSCPTGSVYKDASGFLKIK